MGAVFGWLGTVVLVLIVIGGLIECCSRFSRREVHVFYHKEGEMEQIQVSEQQNIGGVQPSKAWSKVNRENMTITLM